MDINNTLIITFLNKKYIPIFEIFYNYFQKLNYQKIFLVISLDIDTCTYLKQKNINTVYVQYNLQNKELFWKFRLIVINNIFKITKKNIIHTDSDCLWFKDILIEINNLDYDIIGSIAYGYPQNIVKKFGFVVCCGFYYIKYNKKTIYFFDNIIKQNINSTDDQILINNYIFNNSINMNDTNNNLIYKEIYLKNNIKIGILNNFIISRKYQEKLYCFHPYLSSKNISEKVFELLKKIK